MRPLLSLLVFALLAVPIVFATDPPSDARKALDQFYKDRLNRPFVRGADEPAPKAAPPPWELPIKQLASDKPEDRRAAVAYLRELVALALGDERSDKAAWRNTPFWGSGPENVARDARQEMANELEQVKPCDEVLPVLRWYFENEPADSFLEPIVAALGKVDGLEADALRAELATKPHPNAKVVTEALRQIAARKKRLPAETLSALCHHHRTAIRDAARALNAQQGGKDPGAFDAARALRTESLARLMKHVLGLIPDLPAANAEFVKVTVRYLDAKNVERRKRESFGWLVKKDADTVTIYTPYGRVRSFRDKEETLVSVQQESRSIDVVTSLTTSPANPAELITEVVEARKRFPAWINLVERDGQDHHFHGYQPGEPFIVAILGGWLYQAGKINDAAAFIFLALDALPRDEYLVSAVRHEAGILVGFKMLVAFVGDRDYPAALNHARRIHDLYPGTRFHSTRWS